MKTITLLDLFSGIGGFAKGLLQAGFDIKNHYFSETDKYSIAVYQHNFKNSEYVGSVADVQKLPGRPNIITFGSPCQDFSVAGKRTGMEGQRSSLILEAIRIISLNKPDIFIWENVKGVFSSNDGADFWAIIQAFTKIGGYRLEWELVNTNWYLPQNRERIYLVGHLATSKRGFGKVFPIGENDKMSDKTQRKTSAKKERVHIQTNKTACCLTKRMHKMGVGDNYIEIAKVSRSDDGKELRKKSIKEGRDHTPFQAKKIDFLPSKNMNTLTQAIKNDNLIRVKSANKKGYEEAKEGDSINFSVPSSKTRRGRVGKGKAQTLDTACNQGVVIKQVNQSLESGGSQPYQQNRVYDETGILPALNSELSGRNNILIKSKIRRLTEIECERLQGFHRNWTKFGNYNGKIKEISSTQRYKMCGNAVTVDVVEEIGKKLLNQ